MRPEGCSVTKLFRRKAEKKQAIVLRTVQQLEAGRAEIENQYARAVRPKGNPASRRLIEDVFEVCDRKWRGVGLIPKSGFKLRYEYHDHDAERIFVVDVIETRESSLCISEVVADNRGMVILRTVVGGERVVTMLAGEQLPRIC
jgi:hypothetical protein